MLVHSIFYTSLNYQRVCRCDYVLMHDLIVFKFGVLAEHLLVNTNKKNRFKKYSADRGRVLFKICRSGPIFYTYTHYEHVCRCDYVLMHGLTVFKFGVLAEHMLVNTNVKPDLRHT